jgi:parallel beta-helix repeat protein
VFIVVLLLCAGFVLPAFAATTITGHVFEDQGYTGGAGRTFATAGGGVTNARVELYASGGNYICSTATAAGGAYTFTNGTGGCTLTIGNTYVVRVVNSSVVSNYTGGGTGGLIPVQTYRTNCVAANACGAAPVGAQVTNYVGGQKPTVFDAGNGAAGAGVPANSQSITTVYLNSNASLIDFGFNFFTVVNVNASGQGSLAQFITNANALTGNASPSAIFMLYNGVETTGMNASYTNLLVTLSGGTYKGFVINMGGVALPAFTAVNGKIDASNEVANIGGTNPNTASVGANTMCGSAGATKLGTSGTTLSPWTGTTLPVLEIQNCTDAFWDINGVGETVKAMAFHSCTLYVGGSSGVTLQDNLVGVHADGTLTTAVSGNFGISMSAGGGRTINHNYVRINDSAIRNDNQGSTGDTYEYNETTQPQTGQTDTFDGILLIGPAAFANDVVKYNYSHDLQGGGIEIGFSGGTPLTNETIQYNTVCANGWNQNSLSPNIGSPAGNYTYASASGEDVNIAIWDTSQGSQVTIENNLITKSSEVGILVENAYGFTISQNSIYLNGTTGNNLGPGIALFSNCSTCDPNNFGTSGYTGITPNSGTESASSPNYQMNYPVMTLATYIGGVLRVKGYVGGATNLAIANAKIELFIANNTDNNQNGNIFAGDGLSVPHGEGQTYVCSFLADSTGNFDVQLPSASIPGCTAFASGATITVGSTVLTTTATATTGTGIGSTSEFGPNQLVQASALNIQGYVYYDTNHSGSYNLGESWQNGAAVYAVLWDTTKNLQAAVGGTTIGAQTIASGAVTDTGFFSFDNVTPGDTYELLLTTAVPAAGGIYATLPAVSIPSGWIMVNPNLANVSITTSATGPQIIVQNFGLFHGLKVSGEVFKDNGAGTGGVANDGHLNGTEPGIPNLVLTAKDSFSVQLDQETTNGGGAYTLWLPTTDSSNNTVASVTFTISQIGGYTATGFDAGTPATGGAYVTSTYVFTFTPTWTNAAYTGVNFGFIQSGNIFAPNGQQTTVPGSIAIYAHQYTSITGGTVTFTETPVVSQPNYFTEMLYNDTTCSGNLATATYLPWGATGPVTIAAGGGKVCLLMKEMASTQASFGMQNTITITATFSYGSSSTLTSTTLTLTDITVIEQPGSGTLQLVKSTYIDASCTYLNTLGPASSSFSTGVQSAASGNCIEYQIQATNGGASALSGLTINDMAPPYTTLQTGTHSPVSTVGATGCTGLTAGAITVTVSAVQAAFTGSMPGGCIATFVYEVKLN